MVYNVFLRKNLSFVQHPDGFHQYYPKLVYINDYLKGLISSVIHGNFTIPQFDINIGLGEDVFNTMGTWICDFPFTMLTLLVERTDFEKIYMLNVILKMYLAGLSFSYVCIKCQKKKCYVLAGSIAYVFCGYLMRVAPMHPAFIHVFIFFPLVIYGVERIVKKETTYLFIFSLAMIMVRGYYFAYMTTILSFVYGVVRFIGEYKETIKEEFKGIFIKAVLSYLSALLMGAITLLPTIAAFFNSSRSDGGNYKSLLYPMQQYIDMLTGIIIPPGEYDYLAFVSIVIPFLILPFINKKKGNMFLRIILVITGAIFCFPFLGRVMNGFGYPSNRWSFAIAFLAAYCIVDGLEYIFAINDLQLWIITGLVIVYNIILILFNYGKINWIIVPLGLLDLFVALLWLQRVNKKILIEWGGQVTLLIICVSSVVNGIITFDDRYANIAIEYSENGTVDSQIFETTKGFDFQIWDSGYYRINSTNITNENFSVVLGVSTPNIYYSVINSSITNYLKGINLLKAASDFRIVGLDNRVQVESLLGVKYYITTEYTKQYLPFGAELVCGLGDGYFLYENPYAMPMVYSYESYLLKEDYDKLNVLEKQQATLTTAVLEKSCELKKEVIHAKREASPYTIKDSKGIIMYDDGTIEVNETDNYLELRIERKKNTELYVEFEDLKIPESEKNQNIEIYLDYLDVSKTISVTSEEYTWHYDNVNPWVNMGITGDSDDIIYVRFSAPGIYNLKEINIYQNSLAELSRGIVYGKDIKDLKIENNTIECDLMYTSSKILNFNIPYSRNWKLYVDGEEKELQKVNDYSIGAEIAAGEHSIKMIYRAPYFVVGLICSGISWGVFLGVCLLKIRKK